MFHHTVPYVKLIHHRQIKLTLGYLRLRVLQQAQNKLVPASLDRFSRRCFKILPCKWNWLRNSGTNHCKSQVCCPADSLLSCWAAPSANSCLSSPSSGPANRNQINVITCCQASASGNKHYHATSMFPVFQHKLTRFWNVAVHKNKHMNIGYQWVTLGEINPAQRPQLSCSILCRHASWLVMHNQCRSAKHKTHGNQTMGTSAHPWLWLNLQTLGLSHEEMSNNVGLKSLYQWRSDTICCLPHRYTTSDPFIIKGCHIMKQIDAWFSKGIKGAQRGL